MSKKIPVSFKENDEEMLLYATVKGAGDKSDFMKTALKFYMKYRHLEIYLKELEEKQRIIALRKAAIDPE